MHHEIISFSATAPGATGVAGTALTGDSLTIRAARPGSKIVLLNMWGDFQAAGFMQVIAPSFSDTTRAIRAMVPLSEVANLLPWVAPQMANPQELLSTTIAGSATAGDVESGSIWIWYEDVPGLNGRYLDIDGVNSRAVRTVTVANTITTTAGPGYSGSQALNAGSDLLRPNTDYAVLGAVIRVECLCLGVRSPDWSNVRVGIPGNELRPEYTSNWFADASYELGLPLIPILNTGNKAAIFLDAAQDENATAVPFSLNLVELSPV